MSWLCSGDMIVAKTGRPRIEIDGKHFEALCGMMCTEDEIAGFYHCSVDTVERWCKREYGLSFADAFKMYSANGKISLRRMQFKIAERNAAMAIFLGKNYLGQRDVIVQADDKELDEARKILESVKSVIGDDYGETAGISE